MGLAKKLLAVQPAAGGGAFAPTDITWHSLFWASGSNFVAEGYSDTDSVTSWPNETSESDGTASGTPTYYSSVAGLNSQPAVDFETAGDKIATSTFSSAPTYPVSYVIVGKYDTLHRYGTILSSTGTKNLIRLNIGGDRFQLYAGSDTGDTPGDTNAHLFVAKFDGGSGNETLSLDGGSPLVDKSLGNRQVLDITIGGREGTGDNNDRMRGNIAFLGLYEGDIEDDGAWSDFTDWVSTTYGITIT